MASILDRRLSKLEQKYRPSTVAAEEIIITGGPDAHGPIRCTDGKRIVTAEISETLKAFRARMLTEYQHARSLTFFGMSSKER